MTTKYFITETGETNGIHGTTGSNELQLNETIGSANTNAKVVIADGDQDAFVFTTPSGVPNIADIASGSWTLSVDVASAGSNLTYGPVTIDGSSGHFATVDSGLTADQDTFQPTDGAMSGTGPKTWTDTWDPASGSASDRLEVLLVAANSAMHGDETLTINVGDADSFFEAPFSGTTAAVTGTATATIDENDITTGGKTIIIELTGDQWKAAGSGPIGSTADTQAIIDGLDAATSPSLGWNDEVRDKEVTTAVVRTSSTICTITLTAAGDYDISATETITVTVPAAAVDGAVEIDATPTFTVDAVSAAVLPRLALLGVG